MKIKVLLPYINNNVYDEIINYYNKNRNDLYGVLEKIDKSKEGFQIKILNTKKTKQLI
jgi:hypothetical protein